MRISELPQLPSSAKESLQNHGIKDLNPAQDAAVSAGLLSGKSLVVCAPTASGKTLIAELAFLNIILNQKKKAIYLVPLKALGSEKYRDFKEKYNALGIKVALSMGDYDSREAKLADNDIIIATSEKMDSLLRHKADWVRDVGLLIVDEIHLLGDMTRGPTLEVVIARMRALSEFQILGLSATISNADEIAGWLGAELVKSDYRPVKLSRGILSGSKVEMENSETIRLPDGEDSLSSLTKHVLSRGKQALIFVNSRPSAESQAEKLIGVVRLNEKEISEKILNVLEHPTQQCKKLARCVSGGVAFHHAGLLSKQKELVEEGFKSGKIKIIAATPTLAVGVNLPSTYVVIRDTFRFQMGYGMRPLPVMEVEQMSGRAGRPRYDTEGYAFVFAKSNLEAKKHFDHYLCGKPEKVFSQLGLEPALRMHVLSVIATGDAESEDDVIIFLDKTFYAYQFSDMGGIKRTVKMILEGIMESGLITLVPLHQRSGTNRQSMSVGIKATELGRRVAELYIDPDTANMFLQGIKKLSPKHPAISYFHLAAYAREMRPLLRAKSIDADTIFLNIAKIASQLVVSEEYLYDEEEMLSSVKSALLLEAWANEYDEEAIMEMFGVTPGELHAKFTNADWIIYSLQQLCDALSRSDISPKLSELRTRLKYGVKAELLDLVRIRGIGRVKARKLFRLGAKNIEDIGKIPNEELEKVVGQKMAKRLKENAMQGIEEMPVDVEDVGEIV